MYINVHTHTKNLRAFHIQCPDFGNLFEKKKIITNTFFCCLPCWSMQFYKIKEKNLQVPEQHGLQKKK
jgi:hypothetical protein